MARVLTASSSHYLEYIGAVRNTTPLTLACWYKTSDVSQTGILMIQSEEANSHYFYLYQHVSGVIAQVGDGSGADFAASTVAASANVWTHACAVFASSSSRAAYINGTNKGTNSASHTPASIDLTMLGARYTGPGARSLYYDGYIAEAAIWDIALSDAEVASLYVSAGVGIFPTDVQSGHLLAYWPLLGSSSPEPDDVGSADLTVSGAVGGTHLTMQHLAGGASHVVAMMAQNEG